MELKFGKYKGKTLEEVAYLDPGYIVWLEKETLIDIPPRLLIECTNETTECDYEQ